MVIEDFPMKNLFSLSIVTLLMTSVISAQASTESKQIRNDRMSVSKNFHQFEINPFSDSKRVVRNDRISYAKPKVEDTTETVVEKKKRVVRSDRVSIQK